MKNMVSAVIMLNFILIAIAVYFIWQNERWRWEPCSVCTIEAWEAAQPKPAHMDGV